jgi:hypothetical protein
VPGGVATIDLGNDDLVWNAALAPQGRLLLTASIEPPRDPRRQVVLGVRTSTGGA